MDSMKLVNQDTARNGKDSKGRLSVGGLDGSRNAGKNAAVFKLIIALVAYVRERVGVWISGYDSCGE